MINKNTFNKKANHPLQTWEWGEFRKAWGNKVERFDFGQITIHKIPFIPFKVGVFVKGPQPTKQMIRQLKDYAKENNLVFVKLEPSIVPTKSSRTKLIKLLKENNCSKGRRLFTPSTFWIDLKQNEDDLLKSFSSKTRYNIRLAQRRGVKIIEDNSDKAFDKYLKLTFETAKRQGFYAHSKKYHKLMWKHLHKDLVEKNEEPIARLLTARYKEEIITTWIVFVWKDFIYYPYGASSNKYRNVMANNLIMWEATKYGKKLGLKTFDLWGREEGKGFSKFKEGYNPKVVEFLGTWDLVVNPIYYFYKFIENIRWFFLKKLSFIRS